jgi:hypothetical protein
VRGEGFSALHKAQDLTSLSSSAALGKVAGLLRRRFAGTGSARAPSCAPQAVPTQDSVPDHYVRCPRVTQVPHRPWSPARTRRTPSQRVRMPLDREPAPSLRHGARTVRRESSVITSERDPRALAVATSRHSAHPAPRFTRLSTPASGLAPWWASSQRDRLLTPGKSCEPDVAPHGLTVLARDREQF